MPERGPTVTRTLLPGHLVFVKYANIGLGRLTIRTCRVHSGEDLSVFKGVVKEVEWSDLGEEGSSPVSWKALDDHIWGCRHCPDSLSIQLYAGRTVGKGYEQTGK